MLLPSPGRAAQTAPVAAIMQTMHKVPKSAICLVPPRRVWQQIQEIRCFKDKSFVRWPPHVNLLYPFYEDQGDTFARAAKRCSEALQGFSAFQVQLPTVLRTACPVDCFPLSCQGESLVGQAHAALVKGAEEDCVLCCSQCFDGPCIH
jgi:hypothetical protein